MQFDKWLKKEPSGLDKAIEDLLKEMDNFEGHTPEYARCNEQLDKLTKMRTYRKDTPSWVGPAITAGATVAGTLIIVSFELAGHSPVSKALTIFKPKI